MGIGQFLVLFLVSLVVTTSSAAAGGGETNTEFIRTCCKVTTYPRLCYTTLSSHASEIGADAELLAKTALTVTLESTKTAYDRLTRIAEGFDNMTRREAGAMKDCVEELRDSVDRIRKSMEEMKELRRSRPDFDMKMSDIETWVSAALTDDDTCSDGVAGKSVGAGLKAAVKAEIRKVAHLTSNALALINSFASLNN